MTDIYSAEYDEARPQGRLQTGVAVWLGVMCLLVTLMILVGGLTRLTDSGLSITEWKPVTGAIPPITETQWEAELEKYRQIPEYQIQNRGMSLDEFKVIYWWEWGHRFLGRLLGVAFAIPLAIFLLQKKISAPLGQRLFAIFLLGGLQGAIGWWMVSSGLTERLDVSHYRLAVHLGLAFIILAALFWTLLEVAPPTLTPAAEPGAMRLAAFLPPLLFLQIVSGAFVAGLDAGMIYNTWPAMDGGVLPASVREGFPTFAAFFEDRGAVQFLHRTGAYVMLALITLAWSLGRKGVYGRARVFMHAMLALGWIQVALGIVTLLSVTALPLGAAHQFTAVLLFLATLGFAHDSRGGMGAKRFSGSESSRSR